MAQPAVPLKPACTKHLRTISKFGILMSGPKPLMRWAGSVMRASGHDTASCTGLVASFAVATTEVVLFWFEYCFFPCRMSDRS